MQTDISNLNHPFEKFKEDFKSKKVLLLGLGLQGRGVGDAKVFASIGSQVRVSDAADEQKLRPSIEQLQDFEIEYHLGEHLNSDIDWADVIIRNASVPWNHPMLVYARELDKPIKMDAALFFEYAKPSKAIGITGTRGKSTTTTLINFLLSKTGIKTQLAGNITPIASLELLQNFDSETFYVFELSSWQLQAFAKEQISPPISIITNLYPDHLLDRTYSEYIQDKKAIYLNQQKEDVVFLNATNADSQNLAKSVVGQLIWFDPKDIEDIKFAIPGKHNRENLAAAMSLAKFLKLDFDKFVPELENFKGLEFRQQIIGRIGEKLIINDSTSTTPIALSTALKTYPKSVFIIGGTSKKLPTKDLIQDLLQYALKIILLSGSGTDEIKANLPSDLVVGEFDNLKTAVETGFKYAQDLNSNLILSPGFTSFGMFLNEFDRGRQFNHLIQELNEN